ncbi:MULTISPECIES: phosphoribosyl-ATP diphosphatase [Planktothrix]|jgi:phosphoribosyl-ATP pyrophosphohydrolase/phosphoribosyl-AMP cyclohydrolase|uniref:Phosphoribosyl-ATP pyrophosphatase n=1 Tax=Planktothrix rubescens CCAP 1459/22 TaxID=329571 RepID=A0A6J7ZGL7_PLARU|nr:MULTISPECIES: phosphoribosyl-ATP diphosphatase [Planktothrix]CAH2572365.1 Histidine biosynthesis bifunctional protein HisIE [Planktothrix rubescens]MCB8784801.1 phosphoribosyl-ATP diphosphatase [Planktothrix agardhii 1025]MCF3610964.1 phosphoribosyl-ATP diphosphatase [Planktothrix agardhii 1027]MCF3647365.1 phosphoribosyl-ATP diphosphatase [Planktothrix agardhii 1026]MCP9295045.1 phosphoribosyl-ATP diphosphatase [Planktothrix agardhii LY1]
MSTLKPLELSLFSEIDTIRYNKNGLILAIIQDCLEGTVLNWVWMNAEALEKTITSKQVWSCQETAIVLWNSEITVKEIRYNDDSPMVIIGVEEQHQELSGNTLSGLFDVICDRRDYPQLESYTCKLLAGGDNKILKKIGEESAEVVMACKDNEKDAIAGEVADLFYHTLVALAYHDVELRNVYQKLESRRK